MESLGRWFLPYASGISSSYELPWLNGILSILYISIAVVFICKTFDVKGRLTAALIGAVTVTFPTVISTFTYCYVTDAYSLAFLFPASPFTFNAQRTLGDDTGCGTADAVLGHLSGIYHGRDSTADVQPVNKAHLR